MKDAPDYKGTLALVGAGEFLDPIKPMDEKLLARAGGPRVVVLPTAAAPDGPGVPERWAKMGVEHFNALGAQTQAVMALDRAGCSDPGLADQVRAANLIYFSGGKPDYLYKTLEGTPVWAAALEVLWRGGVLAGCSAGAMIMGGFVPGFSMRMGIPRTEHWLSGFGLIPSAVIAPHFDEFPELLTNTMFRGAPHDSFLIGIDRNTGLIGSTGNWEVLGTGRVTVRQNGDRMRYTDGQTVPI